MVDSKKTFSFLPQVRGVPCFYIDRIPLQELGTLIPHTTGKARARMLHSFQVLGMVFIDVSHSDVVMLQPTAHAFCLFWFGRSGAL